MNKVSEPTLSLAQPARLGTSLVISQVAYLVMQAYIPWFAAATHTPLAELGMLSLAQSIVWPLAMLTQLQLNRIYLLRGDSDLLAVFYRLRLLGSLLLIAGALAGAVLTGSGRLLIELALLLALIKCAEGLADIAHTELYRKLRAEKAARSLTVRCAIFIAIYTVSLTLSGHLAWSLLLSLAAMAVWVVTVDLRDSMRFQGAGPRGPATQEAVRAILGAGVLLSGALALSSVSIMVGRWAAMRAGDVTTMAAAALALTVSSVAAVLLTTCQQYLIPRARQHFLHGGIEACKASLSGGIRALHLAFAGLVVAWGAIFLLATSFQVHLPQLGQSSAVIKVTFALAGCYLVSGWLSVLHFKATMVLLIMQRNGFVLWVAVVQALVAAAISFILYPRVGWTAIGFAELGRSVAAWTATAYLARQSALA